MSNYPGLYQRGGMWCVRKRVPVDLAQLYTGTQRRKSLRTANKKEALRLYATALADIEREFALKRAELGRKDLITQALATDRLERLSVTEIDALVLDWWLKRAAVRQGPSEEEYLTKIELETALSERENEVRSITAPAPDEDDPATGFADQLLVDAGTRQFSALVSSVPQ